MTIESVLITTSTSGPGLSWSLGSGDSFTLVAGVSLVGWDTGGNPSQLTLGAGSSASIYGSLQNNAVTLVDNARLNIGAEGALILSNNGTGGLSIQGNYNQVLNDGLIQQHYGSIEVTGFGSTIVNRGTILSEIAGLSVQGQGQQGAELLNSGLITGRTGVEISDFSTVQNAGRISGLFYGLNITGTTATDGSVLVTNGGEIAATALPVTSASANAIKVGLATGFSQFTLVNTGTISAATTAISCGIEVDRITNTGQIFGGIDLGDGNDILRLRSGGEVTGVITLGAGADTFVARGATVHSFVAGGQGGDLYILDDATIEIIENAASAGVDRVMAATSYLLPQNIEELVLMEGGAFAATGNAQNNRLTGNSLANLIAGAGGDDSLFGGAGDDGLSGGTGNDSLSGDVGADVLQGAAGNDSLLGGDDDDRILGGLGSDTLSGGSDADLFIFQRLRDSTTGFVDRILDFAQGVDRIDLTGIDAISTGSRADDAFTFIGASAFSLAAGQLPYVTGASTTQVEGDVNGDGAADFILLLDRAQSLTASDFLL